MTSKTQYQLRVSNSGALIKIAGSICGALIIIGALASDSEYEGERAAGFGMGIGVIISTIVWGNVVNDIYQTKQYMGLMAILMAEDKNASIVEHDPYKAISDSFTSGSTGGIKERKT